MAKLCSVFSNLLKHSNSEIYMLAFIVSPCKVELLNFQKSLFQSRQRVDLKNDISRISKMSVEELVRIACLILSWIRIIGLLLCKCKMNLQKAHIEATMAATAEKQKALERTRREIARLKDVREEVSTRSVQLQEDLARTKGMLKQREESSADREWVAHFWSQLRVGGDVIRRVCFSLRLRNECLSRLVCVEVVSDNSQELLLRLRDPSTFQTLCAMLQRKFIKYQPPVLLIFSAILRKLWGIDLLGTGCVLRTHTCFNWSCYFRSKGTGVLSPVFA